MTQSIVTQLIKQLDSAGCIIQLVTHEEERAERILKALYQEYFQDREAILAIWDAISGWNHQTLTRQLPPGQAAEKDLAITPLALTALQTIQQSRQPGFYILQDFHSFLNNPLVCRQTGKSAHYHFGVTDFDCFF